MAYRPVGFGGSFGGGFGAIGGRGSLSPPFTLNPSPQRGMGAYGGVPGAIGQPTSRFGQVSAQLNTRAAQPLISENFLRNLSGDVDLDTLQNDAARFGVQSGMPLGGGGLTLAGVYGLNRTEQERRAIERQGLQDYLQAIQGTASLLDDPNLAYNIATQNAVWASAPNPELAAKEQMRIWQKQFDALARGAGGGGRSLNWEQMRPQQASVSGIGGGPANRVNNFLGERIEPFATYPALPAYGMPAGTEPAVYGTGQDVYDRWLASISPAGGFTTQGGGFVAPTGDFDFDPYADFFEGYNYFDDYLGDVNVPEGIESVV